MAFNSAQQPRVEVFHWNPRRPLLRGRLAKRTRFGPRIDNFGDLLGPVVVDALRARLGRTGPAVRDAQLLSVGSVLHFARDGAVVWGSGRNGKIEPERHTATRLDVRAVRGPRTRAFLRERGIEVPEVFGDPALLLPGLFPRLREIAPRHDVLVVPNLNDLGLDAAGHPRLDPRRPLWKCLETIAAARLVVGSSLHGVIVAEALGIPARLVLPAAESRLKYEDFYAGTGRDAFTPAQSVAEAVRMDGEPPLAWDPAPLEAAFPAELWQPADAGAEG